MLFVGIEVVQICVVQEIFNCFVWCVYMWVFVFFVYIFGFGWQVGYGYDEVVCIDIGCGFSGFEIGFVQCFDYGSFQVIGGFGLYVSGNFFVENFEKEVGYCYFV